MIITRVMGLLTFIVFSSVSYAAKTNELLTSRHFDQIKENPPQLLLFLDEMPKGGDLHTHLSGATMAEKMINYALNDHLCIDQTTYTAVTNTNCTPDHWLSKENITQNAAFFNGIINAWSMRSFYPSRESSHDHFFATFAKFNAATTLHTSDMLAEVVNRAGEQNESYLELMTGIDHGASAKLGKNIGWDNNFDAFRKKLFDNGLNNIITEASHTLDANEASMKQALNCGTASAKPGCTVKIKYLYQVLREQPPEAVFAQLIAGFELASKDPRVVGINIVQAEDGFISMHDYSLHMQMIGYLHFLYPTVLISLHAGELNSTLVPFDDLRFHISQAVNIAHANRIGHGVDIAYEDNNQRLLSQMAKQHILVEINLTSNEDILGITGDNHPFKLYRDFNVPVALSTDDEGVLRTDLTNEYQKSILRYHLSYIDIKNLARNSLYYSFLPGKNLWSDDTYQHINLACAKDVYSSASLSLNCAKFLKQSEKAMLQWDLEKRFSIFERHWA